MSDSVDEKPIAMTSSREAPKVSVIIPTYNRRSLLQEAIDSVLAQTYPHVELIVVDDGSTDDTVTLLAQYADRLLCVTQKNRGGTAARNSGLRLATGQYVTFLDHDDRLLPQKIERQVRLLESRPDLAVAHCRWHFIDRDGKRIDKIGVLPEGDVFKQLVGGCFIWSGAPLVRRECFGRVGLFDEAIWSSDWDMWLRLAQAGYRFGCVQEPLGEYRIMPDSTMSDVARTERTDILLFEKVFADPTLCNDVKAVHDEALSVWRFWLSRRYYAIAAWDDAQRNLQVAIELNARLLSERASFLETLCNEALDVRVDDALVFVDGVFSHLPPVAAEVESERMLVRARVQLGLALRAYANEQIEVAQQLLRDALTQYPPLLDRSEDFAKMLVSYAMRLPVASRVYIDTVMANLPLAAQRWKRLRAHALSDLNVACAFEDYFAGSRHLAARRMLSALRYRPGWLRNRGVISVLVKSLPRLLARPFSAG